MNFILIGTKDEHWNELHCVADNEAAAIEQWEEQFPEYQSLGMVVEYDLQIRIDDHAMKFWRYPGYWKKGNATQFFESDCFPSEPMGEA